MTQTQPLSAPRPTLNGNRLGTPLPTRQRKPGYIALGIALIVGFGAIAGYLYMSAGQKTAVVVVVKNVPAGHTVSRDDLSTIEVAGAVTAVAGANLASVVGQTATVQILPNTLLQRAMLTDAEVLGADQAEVGVALKPGQIPADGLTAGDTVQVLQLPTKDGTNGSTAQVLVEQATVFTSRADPSQAGGTVVTLVVPKTGAAAVAAASSNALAALVKVSGP